MCLKCFFESLFFIILEDTIMIKSEINLFKYCCFVALKPSNNSYHYIPIETKNKIEIGHKMIQVIDKKRTVYKRRQNEKDTYRVNRDNQKLVIKCENESYNHYYGQLYKKFSTDVLASKGWKDRYHLIKYFTVNPYGPHPGLNLESAIESFKDLNLNQNLINTLSESFHIYKPSKIQTLSYKKLSNFEHHYLIVAETGCGKTLAYVLPLIEFVSQMKRECPTNRQSNEPIGLAIVPTRELAFQLYDVLTKFNNDNFKLNIHLELDESVINMKENYTDEKINCDNEIPDIIISIPSKLKDGFRRNRNYIASTYLKKVIIDEANLLLDDSNSPYLIRILNKLQINTSLNDDMSTQLIFVSATIPRDMQKILENVIDCSNQLEIINTENVNKVMLHVPQKFLRVSFPKRDYFLLEIAKNSVKSNRNVMIFSNRAKTAHYVHRFLAENDVKSELFHSDLTDEHRVRAVDRFMHGITNIISCTDIASRGLDTVHVHDVVNYEMPQFIADYVHRIGRVNRMGSAKNGLVTNFVTQANEVDLVWNIEASIRKSSDLPNLNANISRIMHFRYGKEINKKDE